MPLNDRVRPLWRDVEASLDPTRIDALRGAVRDWIDEFMPRNIPLRKGRAELRDVAIYQRRLDFVIARHLGPWYGHRGWRIANESFGGCFCHSFLGEYVGPSRADGVERATQWVVAEVGALTRCLREFSYAFQLFGHPPDPGDRAAAIATTLDHLFEAVIDGTACNGPWHHYVVDGIGWLTDVREIEHPPVLEALIEATVASSCGDFIPTPRSERYRLCDDLSTVLVLASQESARDRGSSAALKRLERAC